VNALPADMLPCLSLLVGLAAWAAASGGAPKAKPIQPPPLPDRGLAPELTNDAWLNTDRPLRLEDLRGKVVLLQFWTYGCVNCQRVVPSIRSWHETYGAQGLVVIGNHFPEFPYEAGLGNLRQAVERLGIRYAVAQDNRRETWDAFAVRFWPTLVLVDKRGHVRYRHAGEGAYLQTEAAIRALLDESVPAASEPDLRG